MPAPSRIGPLGAPSPVATRSPGGSPRIVGLLALVLLLALPSAGVEAQVSRVTPGRIVLEPDDRGTVRLDGRGLDGYTSARVVDRRGNDVRGIQVRYTASGSLAATLSFETRAAPTGTYGVRILNRRGATAIDLEVVIARPNQPPVIRSVQAPSGVLPGEPFEVTVDAEDDRGLDRVVFSWTGGGRTVSLSGTSGTARVAFDDGIDQATTIMAQVFDVNGLQRSASPVQVSMNTVSVVDVSAPEGWYESGAEVTIEVRLSQAPYRSTPVSVSSSEVSLTSVGGDLVVPAGTTTASGRFQVSFIGAGAGGASVPLTASAGGGSRSTTLRVVRLPEFEAYHANLTEEGVSVGALIPNGAPIDLAVLVSVPQSQVISIDGPSVIYRSSQRGEARITRAYTASSITATVRLAPRDVLTGVPFHRRAAPGAFGMSSDAQSVTVDFPAFTPAEAYAGSLQARIGPIHAESGAEASSSTPPTAATLVAPTGFGTVSSSDGVFTGTTVPRSYVLRDGPAGSQRLFTITGTLELEYRVEDLEAARTRPSRAIVRCWVCPNGNCGQRVGPAAQVFDITAVPSGRADFEVGFDGLGEGVSPFDIDRYECTLDLASSDRPTTLVRPDPSAPEWWAKTSSSPVVVVSGPIG